MHYVPSSAEDGDILKGFLSGSTKERSFAETKSPVSILPVNQKSDMQSVYLKKIYLKKKKRKKIKRKEKKTAQ